MKNLLVLGLDVSISCTGYCVLDRQGSIDLGLHVVEIDRIELSKFKSFWEKADAVRNVLRDIASRYVNDEFCVAIEEPLLGFKQGMSSAATLAALLKFNGIVSYLSRETFSVDPIYASATHARKVCGVKIQKTSACGLSAKEQTFLHMSSNDLKHVNWPTNRNGKIVPWSRDATDAYCIARAISIENS